MAEPAHAGPGEGKRSRSARPLTDQEVSGVIARNFVAVLATVADEQPYAVPFIYGFEDNAFYAVVAPGRKVENIRQNPNVCITIVETEDLGKRWKSVVATGPAGFVDDEAELARALDVIRRQYPGMPVRSAGGTAALHGYLMMRVGVQELTGRGHD